MKLEEKIILDWQLIKKLFVYLSPYKIQILLSLCLLIATKAIEVIIPIFVGSISQKILDNPKTFPNFGNEFVYIFLLLILAYLMESVNVWLRGTVGRKATLSLRSAVYTHVQKLPMEFFDKTPVGKLMTRTIHDVDQIHQMLAESFVPLVGNFLLFIGIFAGIF